MKLRTKKTIGVIVLAGVTWIIAEVILLFLQWIVFQSWALGYALEGL